MSPPYDKPGRPRVWPSQVSAPPLALEFYAFLAELQSHPEVFAPCHVYGGSSVTNGQIPVIKWQGKTQALPAVAASYLGLPYSGAWKTCATIGCCNPLHYTRELGTFEQLIAEPTVVEAMPDYVSRLADMVETVEYLIDQHNLKPPYVFAVLREYIPVEDMCDADLELALTSLSKVLD